MVCGTLVSLSLSCALTDRRLTRAIACNRNAAQLGSRLPRRVVPVLGVAFARRQALGLVPDAQAFGRR